MRPGAAERMETGMRTGVAGRALIAAAVWAAGAAHAQEDVAGTDGEESPPAERPIRTQVKFGAELGFSANLDDAAGDVSTSRATLGVTVEIPADLRGKVILGYDYEISAYDFSSTTTLVPGVSDPLDAAFEHGLSATYTRQQTERFGWYAGGAMGLSYERGAEVEEAFTWRAFGGASYAISESLTLGGGLAIATRLEDDPWVLPLLNFDWQISEKWSLFNEGGPGVTLGYYPNEAWRFSVRGSWAVREYRLADDGPIPSGVARDSAGLIELGARWVPTQQLVLSAGVGVLLARELEFEDSRGLEVGSSDVDATPVIRLSITYRF